MSIKVWDYLDEYAAERGAILAAVERVFESGVLILGHSVRQFESEFARYCDVSYGVGVDNATNGIFLALKALDIGGEDEVITVSNTAVPTVSAIVQAGAIPRFIDVHPDSGLMNVSQLETVINSRTKCVVPVHLYGQCVDMTELVPICQKYNLAIVEDCSQAHGAKHNGQVCGSMGDLGVFSFYPTKPLGAYGDGGMVITSNAELDARLRRLRFYGMRGVYYAEEQGYNSRLDEVQAEILRVKLKGLNGYIARRQALARRYDQMLASTSLRLPVTTPNNTHVFYVYVAQHRERDRIIAEMKTRDIFLNISYPWPIHLMRGYSFLGGKEGDLPHTEERAKHIFSLPLYPSLTEKVQDIVCIALGEVLGEKVSI